MVFSVIYVVFSYRMVVLRLHDMNLSGWLVLLYALERIPEVGWIIALLFTAFLVFAPGIKGDNNYGSQSELGSKIGLLVFAVIIPLILAAVGYVEYKNSGKKKQIEESIKLIANLEYSIFEYYEKNQKLPNSLKDVSGWQEILQASPIIEHVDLTNDGMIEISYSDKIKENTHIQIAPHIDKSGMTWHCYATNLSYKVIPEQCILEIDEYSKTTDL